MGCQYNKCLNCEIARSRKDDGKSAATSKRELARFAADRMERLTSLREQLKYTPLFEVWYHGLNQQHIDKLYLSSEVLFAETASNELYAFDRKTGVPYWVYTLGGKLDFPPEVYEDKVFLVTTGTLHNLDKKTGLVLQKYPLDFVPCSPLCIADDYLYVGSWDNFIYTLNMKTGEREWRYRIDGHVVGRPTVSDGNLFVAATDGRVYAINGQSGNTIKTWGQEGRYTTKAPNVLEVVAPKAPPLLYVASRDYNLYSLNRINGDLRWKFESGGEIVEMPYLVGNLLYTISEREVFKDSVLYALESDSGQVKWSLDHGKQILFLGKKHDWIVQHSKKLAQIQSENGHVKNVFDLSAFDVFVTNIQDNAGYLATNDGFIFAVEEK